MGEPSESSPLSSTTIAVNIAIAPHDYLRGLRPLARDIQMDLGLWLHSTNILGFSPEKFQGKNPSDFGIVDLGSLAMGLVFLQLMGLVRYLTDLGNLHRPMGVSK